MLRARTRAPARGTTEVPSVTVLTGTPGAATTTLVPPMPTTRVRTKSETIASAGAAANPLFASRGGATLVLMIPTIFNSAETRTLDTARELGSQSPSPTDLRRTIETRLRTAVHRDSTNQGDMLTDLAVATTTRATLRDVSYAPRRATSTSSRRSDAYLDQLGDDELEERRRRVARALERYS